MIVLDEDREIVGAGLGIGEFRRLAQRLADQARLPVGVVSGRIIATLMPPVPIESPPAGGGPAAPTT